MMKDTRRVQLVKQMFLNDMQFNLNTGRRRLAVLIYFKIACLFNSFFCYSMDVTNLLLDCHDFLLPLIFFSNLGQGLTQALLTFDLRFQLQFNSVRLSLIS